MIARAAMVAHGEAIARAATIARVEIARVVLFMAAGAALLCACASRDHVNPFDPSNPETNGRPENLRAVAGDGTVTLNWDDSRLRDITGFMILRASGADVPAALLQRPLLPSARDYVDGDVQSGVTYRYQLATYVNDQQEALLGAEEAATPGSQIAWTADALTGRAWRLSPDAREIVAGALVSNQITDLAVVDATGDAWVTDLYGSKLLRVPAAADSVLETVVAPSGVAAVATTPDGRRLFAGSYTTGTVWGYGLGHAQRWSDDSTFTAVQDLAWNESDGSLWVADKGGRIARLDGESGQRLSWLAGFSQPLAVALSTNRSVAWVADPAGSAVYKIAATGDSILAVTHALTEPADVADDPQGGCWAADAAGGRVVRFSDDLSSVLVTIGNLSSPRAVRVDPATRDVWIAESGNGRIVRYAGDGTFLTGVDGLVSPFVLAIAWNPGGR